MAQSSFEKINIIETNNFFDQVMQNTENQASKVDYKKLSALRKYIVKKGFSEKETSEFKFVVNALKWVSSQWEHDGINQPPLSYSAIDILKCVHTKKEKYRCVEYGLVLAEILQAYGFETRTLGLRTKDAAYGGFGQGHVAMEVWINEINKWVFLDPQFGAYGYSTNLEWPLSFYELFLEKKSNRWDQLNIAFVFKQKFFNQKLNQEEYKKFLKRYFGYVSISSDRLKSKIALFLETTQPIITFQGMSSDNIIFTHRALDLYPEMNKVGILLKFIEANKNFHKTVKKLNIKTNEDYLKSMGEFAVKPHFEVSFITNMNELDYYEYKISDKDPWKKLDKKIVTWKVLNSSGTIRARAINKLGRAGSETFIKIKYE